MPLTPAEQLEQLYSARKRDLVSVDQPLVLIAQPARSGGTLLSTLFDGHPELHSHPFELQIGYPDRHTWPRLDLGDEPHEWFRQLRERHAQRALTDGYRKDRPAVKLGLEGQIEALPLLLDHSFQRDLFIELVGDREITSTRAVLDCYMTSYFNAWLDNQNLRGPSAKRWVVGFRGAFGTPENADAFFDTYMDGRFVTIVRDARGWIASARRFYRHEADLDAYIDFWLESVEWRVALARERPDRVALVTFEQLVTSSRKVMRRLADWMGIEFDPILEAPTFNRIPVRANSSFVADGRGVVAAPLDNWRQELDATEVSHVEERTASVYAAAEEVA